MNVRPATLADAPAIAAIHVASWQHAYIGLVPQPYLDSLSIADFTNLWQSWLPSPPGQIVLVAEAPAIETPQSGAALPGVLQGFAGAGPIRSPLAPFTAELYALYLLPVAQRHGLGRRLVHAISAQLAALGHSNLILWSLRDNPAIAFYRRLGGQPIAEDTTDIAGVTLPTTAFAWSILPHATTASSDSAMAPGTNKA